MHPIVRWLTISLLAASATFASGSVAAADCKIDTDETDKFTKVRTLVTRRNSLESFWGDSSKDKQKDIYVAAYYKDGSKALQIGLWFTNYVERMPPDYELRNTLVVPKESRLLVMMADGSVVTLHSVNPINANSKATRTTGRVSVDTGATIYYPLDDDLIAALTSQDATKIRVEASETHYDFEVHEKSLGDIGSAIQCLQANL
jgi:hypothetical protein